MALYRYLTATANVKSSAGKLKGIFCSSSSSASATIYDSAATDTTRTILGVFNLTAGTMLMFSGDDGGVYFTNGLYVVLSGTCAVTIIYE